MRKFGSIPTVVFVLSLTALAGILVSQRANAQSPLVLAPPPAIMVSTDPGVCSAVVSAAALGTATSTGGVPPVTISNAPPGGTIFLVGATTVIWTATDSDSPPTIATATQTVTVVDTTPPSIVAPPSVTVLVGTSSSAIGTATATDNCPGVQVSNNTPATFSSAGTTAVVWTATDASGNSAIATQTVTVLTPAQASQNLISTIKGMNLPRGLTTSLVAKLNDAIASLNVGDCLSAKQSLEDLISQASAQSGRMLTVAQASQLITATQSIINSLPC